MNDKKTRGPLITLTSEVDPLWIEFVTNDNDLFKADRCGLYLHAVKHTKARGWLVFEADDRPPTGKEPNRKEAIAAWKDGEMLPPNWYRLDEALALKAWGDGVKWRGEKWFEKGDASAYQLVVQLALFGEERYA